MHFHLSLCNVGSPWAVDLKTKLGFSVTAAMMSAVEHNKFGCDVLVNADKAIINKGLLSNLVLVIPLFFRSFFHVEVAGQTKS